MSVKIAVIWSSSNTDGLTAAAKNKFIAGPMLETAGKIYAKRIVNGFDMQY